MQATGCGAVRHPSTTCCACSVFASTQPETENINRVLYHQWFPQILYNHHQSGPAGTVVYSPPQSEVTVTVLPEGAVSIADHGSGIPEQDRPRIFERFWRGRAAQGQGAGLGLAIVAQVAAAHGGSVEVEETPGGGATFTLRLQSVEDNATATPRDRIAATY